jgi:hypothetical protein
MNHGEYPQYEKDPVTGRDDDDLYFLPEDERNAVVRNIKPEGVTKNEKEREIFERLRTLNVFEIIKHMVDRVDLCIADPVVKGTIDIHDIRIDKHALSGIESILKAKGWDGTFADLKENDPIYYPFLMGIISEIGY